MSVSSSAVMKRSRRFSFLADFHVEVCQEKKGKLKYRRLCFRSLPHLLSLRHLKFHAKNALYLFEFEPKPEKWLILLIMGATLEKANIKMDQTCITLWI